MLATQKKQNGTAKKVSGNPAPLNDDHRIDAWKALFLPGEPELGGLLTLRFGDPVSDLLDQALLKPIRYLTNRNGKRIRGNLVRLVYRLVNQGNVETLHARQQLKLGADIIELIHTGSLVVDDIEDGSKTRRGQPSLHCRFGLPLALNAGNWLYFWPLEMVRKMKLPEEKELRILRLYQRTLLRAHFGQALDLGVRIDSLEQGRVSGICLASMELKTGALISFALGMGAILGGASARTLSALDEFGHGFGVALQMFDDLGNLGHRLSPAKRFEDLLLRRPSWVWACAARNYPKRTFEQFLAAVAKLPASQPLEKWLAKTKLEEQGRQQADEHLETTFQRLDAGLAGELLNREALGQLREMGRLVTNAYD